MVRQSWRRLSISIDRNVKFMYASPRNIEKRRAFSTLPMMPFTRVPAGISSVLPMNTGSATTATNGSPSFDIPVPMGLSKVRRTCVP